MKGGARRRFRAGQGGQFREGRGGEARGGRGAGPGSPKGRKRGDRARNGRGEEGAGRMRRRRAGRAGSGSTSRRPGCELMPGGIGRSGSGSSVAPGRAFPDSARSARGIERSTAPRRPGRGAPAQARREAASTRADPPHTPERFRSLRRRPVCEIAPSTDTRAAWALRRHRARSAGGSCPLGSPATRERRIPWPAIRPRLAVGRGGARKARGGLDGHDPPVRSGRTSPALRARESTRADPPHTPERFRALRRPPVCEIAPSTDTPVRGGELGGGGGTRWPAVRGDCGVRPAAGPDTGHRLRLRGWPGVP